ncbi:MAG TPA: AMP-binding protein [Burkholderiales bacterium]|nr:AMP-binding protein [Burkholderiales bacterium]
MSANPFASDWLRAGGDDARRPRGGQSYVAGTTAEPLRFLTIPALLDRAVSRHGARDAAVFAPTGERLSWHDLKRGCDDVAAGLLALGVGRGDRVGIWAPNCAEWLLVQLGSARIGAILVNINPAYRGAELEHALKKTRCRVLVMAAALKSSDYVAMMKSLAPEIETAPGGQALRLARFPDLEHIVLTGDGPRPPGMLPFRELTALAGPAHRNRLPALCAALDPDDAINIQFTSGTTGLPKGATLSHYNIVNNARFSARAMRLTHEDRLCIPVPLYHCFGMVLGVLACVATGALMVFPAPSFDAEATLRAVQAHRCTALHGVPAMFVAELAHPGFRDFDLSSLRTGIMAGAPCPIETMRRVMAEMHMNEVTIAYGMTETSPVSFQSDVDDPVQRRVSTVGRILPHLEVKIVDERGRIVPVGRSGELCTRGYSVMLGYWDDPQATGEAIDAAGWMHSGDLATLDADGYCNIVGRLKDMLIRGGENVFPREIEEYLYRHPKVMEAQVFGVPDPAMGEEICAWIVLKPGTSATEDEIRDFCRAQIAHYKIPRYVRFVAELPKTVTGKPQKFAMREAMMRELKLSEARTA